MKALLDQVATYLSENPAISLDIRGHSNDPRDVGYKLSQKRVGIDPARRTNPK